MPELENGDYGDCEPRVLAHPRDKRAGQSKAEALGFALQVTDLCPPGTVYVLDPSKMFSDRPEDEGWEFDIGRVDGPGR